MAAIYIVDGSYFQNSYGIFKHNSIIGKRFGEKVYCSKNLKWCVLLHPTPELWTLTLKHRTQILFSTDISLIALELTLKPGVIVVEAGTGSGSLSHAIARSILPNGHLYTFDFHEERSNFAQKDFEKHGLSNVITMEARDVCAHGFGLERIANAVFLDLPSPWLAVPHLKNVMSPVGGRVCFFSPCIEQVQRTCKALREDRFICIQTKECLNQPLMLKNTKIAVPKGLNAGVVSEAISNEMNPDNTIMGTDCENIPDILKSKGDRNSDSDNAVRADSFMVKSLQPCGNLVYGHTGFLTFATYPPVPL